jgi:hypothetical protein
MEKNTKIILAIGIAGLVYFLYKKGLSKKENTSMLLPTESGTLNKYPVAMIVTSSQEGRRETGKKVQLKDGDAVKGVEETIFVLKGGEKHPVTQAWWIYNVGEDYSNVINITNTTLDLIPNGVVFTINGK